MRVRLHPTWSLAARRLGRLAKTRYGIEPQSVTISPVTMEQKAGFRYNPATNRLVLSSSLIDNSPRPIPRGPVQEIQFQLQEPRLFGAVAAVFAPLVWSPWRSIVDNGPPPNEEHYAAALLLDQVRAEKQETMHRPFNRVVLQAHTLQFLPNINIVDTMGEFLHILSTTVYARIKAGIIKGGDSEWLEANVRRALGDSISPAVATTLLSIVDAALEADGTNPAEMLGLGKQWSEAVEAIDGLDAPVTAPAKTRLWSIAASLKNMVDHEIRILQLRYPPLAPIVHQPMEPTSSEEWANRLDQEEIPDREHDQSGGEDDDHDNYVAEVQGIPKSRWLEYRNATTGEHNEVSHLARKLRGLRYRKPMRIVERSQTPHGRMNNRELVQMTAQRIQGTRVTATPWMRARHIQSEQPGLTCALVLDTSRSMDQYRNRLVSLNWVFSQAVAAVGGTVSAWGFGGDAFEIIRADTRPRQVPVVVDSGAGSSGAARALAHAAADARLETATGTRVAVVVTDTNLGSPEESERLSKVFTELQEKGVHTFLLHMGNLNENNRIHGAVDVSCRWGADLPNKLADSILSVYAPA